MRPLALLSLLVVACTPTSTGGLVTANSASWREGDGNMRLVVQYSHPDQGGRRRS